jgi:hypothetical protein
MAISTEKQLELSRLIEHTAQARTQISSTCSQLHDKLDLISRAKTSVSEEPMKWIGGSAAVGLATSFIFRPKKRHKEMAILAAIPRIRGLIWKLLVLVTKLIKPVAKIYATKLFKDQVHGELHRCATGRQQANRIRGNR